MINYPYPTEFLGEAVQKNLLITDGTVTVSGDDYTVTGDTITITNSDLEEEAFEMHQSINSDMQLRFGSCESAYIAFVIRKSGISSLIGKVLKVYIIPNHNASKILQLGVFKVQTDKLSYDGTRRSVSAYDAMYDVLNSDVADWYNTELPDDSTTTTVGALAQSFLSHFGLTLSGSINSLPNKDKVIRRTIDPDQLSGADVIKAICEINGVFGRINNEGEFQFFLLTTDIRTSVSTWEIPIANYIDIQFDDYDSKKIDALKIITDAGVAFYSFAPLPQNTYTISGNFLISDYDTHSINDLASRLKMRYYNHYYTACTVNALGNPVLEPGDPIKVVTKNGETYTYILERHMRGIQALRDTYTAHGEEYSTESLNNISNRYSRVNSEVSRAVSQAIVQTSGDFPEIIRNIGFRLLDEPSNVSVEYFEPKDTWVAKSWNKSFYGEYVWKDGDDIYYSRYGGSNQQYVLNKSTHTWEDKTWYGLQPAYGNCIWTDGENIYYSDGNGNNYVLDRATDTWSPKTWNGYSYIKGTNIWTDGENIYFSYYQTHYALVKATDTWVEKTWNSPIPFNGYDIWKDGDRIYAMDFSTYELNKATDTWTEVPGLYEHGRGKSVWTDGNDIYFSSQYGALYYQSVLNKSTNSWEAKTWEGYTDLEGKDIWTDGTDIYFSSASTQYVLT